MSDIGPLLARLLQLYGCNVLNLGNSKVISVHSGTARQIVRDPGFQGDVQVVDFTPITSMYGAVHCSSQVSDLRPIIGPRVWRSASCAALSMPGYTRSCLLAAVCLVLIGTGNTWTAACFRSQHMPAVSKVTDPVFFVGQKMSTSPQTPASSTLCCIWEARFIADAMIATAIALYNCVLMATGPDSANACLMHSA